MGIGQGIGLFILLAIVGLALFLFFSPYAGAKEKSQKELGMPIVKQWTARFQDQVDYFRNNPL